MNYICRDYLGNITHVTDHSGKLLAEYSYDVWGRMRNPVSQNVYVPGSAGQNVWAGADIAAGRSQFSFKNTPVAGRVQAPHVSVEPDAMPNASQPSKPMASVTPSDEMGGTYEVMTPYAKGVQGVNRAIEEFRNEGGNVLNKEVTIELVGVRNRFDFVGLKDSKYYLFEVKNGPHARMTLNQSINIPKMSVSNPPAFIPRGNNASFVRGFTVGKPFTGKYVVIYRHYF